MNLANNYTINLLTVMTLISCGGNTFKGNTKKSPATPPPPKISVKFDQIKYQNSSETYVQGSLGSPQKQTLNQITPPLDLLIVIDNSDSMWDDQVSVASRMPPLLSEISNSDWQISVVTTHRDMDYNATPHCFRDLIKKSDPNAQAKYEKAIKAGTGGNGMERGLPNALLGLKGGCLSGGNGIPDQTPWIRENSILSVFIVTDENNCSQNGSCGDGRDWEAEFANYISSIRTFGETARFYGIITMPSTPDNQVPQGAYKGYSYANLVTRTGGHMGSIADADFTPTMKAISSNLAQMLKTKIQLQSEPDPGSLKISLNGQPWTKYTIKDTTVTFTEVPSSGSQLEVTYTVGKSGEFRNTVPLQKTPLLDSIKVTFDDNSIEESKYHWDEKGKLIIFNDNIPEKTKVVVNYSIDEPLKKSFPIGKTVKTDTVEITVDGKQYTGEWNFDDKEKVITMDPPPPAGSRIEVLYYEEGTKI
ncbi:MAG: hypothetical protein HQK54_03915 [Oligoflexales bacterium]|nr:hypothetical protein [Oligoflexales bacterium]